jgi:hypothetical protein
LEFGLVAFTGVKTSDTSYLVFTARASTWAEPDGIIVRDELKTGKGLRIVELMMDAMDSNNTLRLMLEIYKSKE